MCAIMQPTYFPWAGYFSLLGVVDVFVFLDDVQFVRGSWQNRNRVLVAGEEHWITVPATRERLGQLICQTGIDERPGWRSKHLRLLEQSYARHAHAAEMLEVASLILRAEWSCLADLNIAMISEIASRVGIETPLVLSSRLGIGGGRTDRLIAICEHLGCDEYVSPPGSSTYLTDDGFLMRNRVRLSFHDFRPEPYPQRGSPAFVSHLSVLDVAANLGWRGVENYIRKPPLLYPDVSTGMSHASIKRGTT
jgi:hypothetical protein